MRLLAFVIGLLVLFCVRTQFNHVAGQITSGRTAPVPMLQYTPPQTTYVDGNEVVNQMYPQIDVNSEEYERIAVQAQADQAVQQARVAQDQAWQAEHP